MERTVFRIVAALISFILLLFFTVPFTAGIVNIGNCFGAAVSAVALCFFIFNKQAVGLIKTMWSNLAGRITIIIVSAAAVCFLLYAVIISVFMVRAALDKPGDNRTTVVVLGCKVKEGRPSMMLKRRLDAAYDYLCDHENTAVIVSGGKGNDEIISEAQCMYDYLIEKGISPERIIIEDKSSSTYENLKFSKEIIQEKELEEKITIITDGYHQLRAEMIANDLDLEAYNISASTNPGLVPTYWVREWFGIAYQFLFG